MKRKKRKIYIAFDLAKAYDIINRHHLFDFLDKRVSTESDHQILNLVKNLCTNKKIMIGDKSFFPTKGTQQRSVLAPMIFNLYLDTII